MAPEESPTDGGAQDGDGAPAAPDDAWVREVLRLTRRARTLEATDAEVGRRTPEVGEIDAPAGDGAEGENAATLRRKRDGIAERHGYGVNVRETDDVLVCYPLDWLDGDTVDPSAVEDTDRAVEVPLAGGGDDVEAVREANDAVLDPVLDERDDAVAYNAAAFAEYCENHHRCRIGDVAAEDVAWFLEEYYPRNVWPPDGAEDHVEEALERLFVRVDRDDLVDWLDRRDG